MKVYALFPQGIETGGPEALHQLIAELLAMRHDAYLVPHPDTEANPGVPDYSRYPIQTLPYSQIESDGLVIFPEIYADLALTHPSPQRAIWWLSVDNSPAFYSVRNWLTGRYGRRTARQIPRVLVRMLRSPSLRRRLRADRSLAHYFQSHYAMAEVQVRIGMSGPMLSDYTTHARCSPNTPRRARVAYNPAKGRRQMEKVRRLLAHEPVDFVPLQGLDREALTRTLRGCAIYVDTGHHPGKDRIPREARASGCVVLTSKRGSAANEVDVPIPNRFKFGHAFGARRASQLILRTLEDLPGSLEAQGHYLDSIEREPITFKKEVLLIFGTGTG